MTAKFDNNDGRIRGRALQARRLKVWSKDPRCAKCRKLCEFNALPGRGFQLDHKNPIIKGGPDTEENCQVLCCGPGSCHDMKTAKDLGHAPTVRITEDGWPEGM
ncbi:HNH endonuclease [Variovorax atrisoli]|uniref:HNH endonuclease n=1 Tax=Variovorax atrisoli TaxID=3394203 RepID=UPI00160EF79D|nr:HNH endonuclease signature motif containing protein [Variovorax sp. BK613]MBB3639807.1 hypothetical protein [Variovorax sp. BK613]